MHFFFSISLFKINKAFEQQFFPGVSHNRLYFLLSPPLPCKIYEVCPGAHEFLPRLIPCDRITTVSAPQQELIQDRVYWSFGEAARGGRAEEGKEGGGRGWGGVRGWEETGIFFAFRTTGKNSQTDRGEWKRLVSLAFQLRSEPVYSHSWITQYLSHLHTLPLAASSDLWEKIISIERWGHAVTSFSLRLAFSLTLAHKSERDTHTHTRERTDPTRLFPLCSWSGSVCSLTLSASHMSSCARLNWPEWFVQRRPAYWMTIPSSPPPSFCSLMSSLCFTLHPSPTLALITLVVWGRLAENLVLLYFFLFSGLS